MRDGLLGAQVDDALVAVDEDRVAVQRLAGDALGLDHQRDGQARATMAAWLPTEPSSSTTPLSVRP